MPSTRDYATAAAVFTGSMVLFGPLTFGLLVGAVSILTGLAGVSLGDTATAIVQFAAVLVAVEVVTSIAAVQLGGFAALHDGARPRRLLRHGVLGLAVAVGAIVAVSFLVDVIRWSLSNGRQSYVAMAGLVTLALVWVAVSAARAFRAGYGGS